MLPIELLKPLVGAVIGYITNDIAIRMLFRPRTAKYVFGIRIPFTPGIIPKEKKRIALSLGNAISKNLMNQEVVERTLLSVEMKEKISKGVMDFFQTQARNPQTVKEFLCGFCNEAEIDELTQRLTSGLSGQISSALQGSALGNKLAHIIVEHALMKVGNSLFGLFGTDQMLSLLSGAAEKVLGKQIDEIIQNNSEEISKSIVGDQIEGFLQRRMCDIFQGREEQAKEAARTAVSIYSALIVQQLPKALKAIDITTMIEKRINEMDERDTEQLILSVMKKELRAIVWLGALLGFIMGWLYLI